MNQRVMEHLRIFSNITTLIIGGATVSYLYFTYKNYRYPVLKPFIYFIAFFNLKTFSGLFLNYYLINVGLSHEKYLSSSAFNLFETQAHFFFFLTTYSLFFLVCKLVKIRLTKILRKSLVFIAVLSVMLYIVRTALLILDRSQTWIRNLHLPDIYVYLFYALTFLFLAQLLIKPSKTPNHHQAKLNISFGFFYTGMFAILLSSAFFTRYIEFVIILVTKTLMNLFPFIWIKLLLLKYGNTIALMADETSYPSVKENYGITPREWDIIRHILQGKSNQEISRELCIAPHTVKNHIYRLYRKLHVNNRYQLVNFFLKHKNPESSSISTNGE